MSNTFILVASLFALLSFPAGTFAQDAGRAKPTATSTPRASAFGISPERGADPAVTEKGYFVFKLTPGDEASGSVQITNPGTEPVTVELAEVDAETAQRGGSAYADSAATPIAIATWLRLNQSQVTIEPGDEASVAFTIQPPGDTAPGQYLAGIVAYVAASPDGTPLAGEAGQAGASIIMQTRYAIAVQVDVPGEWTPELSITGASAMEQPSGTQLGITMTNTGDTFIKPKGKVTLSNSEATPILTQPIEMGTFLTNTDLTYPVAWPGVPAGGEYGVEVELNYADDQVARYSGVFTVSDDAPVAAPAPGDATQPATAPASVSATSFIQPWMIIAIGALLLTMVILLAAMLFRGRRSSTR